jgi:hypothetical protein
VKYVQSGGGRAARAQDLLWALVNSKAFLYNYWPGGIIVMLVIPGRRCSTCEGPTRRELLRAGSIGMLGLNLANFFAWQKTAKAANKYDGARGFGAAKSVIMVFLQGGPSHIDIWDPKPDAPANIRGDFKGIPTKIPGTHIGEHMPMMAKALTRLRSSVR